MNTPIGRLASLSPARLRRIARVTLRTASSCPITTPPRCFSMSSRRACSSPEMRDSGMPVIEAITSRIAVSPTSIGLRAIFSRHCFSTSCSLSRKAPSRLRSRQLVVLHLDRPVLLPGRLLDLLLEEFQRLGDLSVERPGTASGLVHHVDGLVGKEPIGHITTGQTDAGRKRLVRIAHAMVRLVLAADVAQHMQRLLGRRLLDDDLLKTALQRAVGFDVLAVFVHRRRADALQLAPCQGGLQYIGRVERSLRASGPDDRMNFVDEQNHVAARQLLEQRVDTLLELSPVFRSGHQRRHVERKNPLVKQHVGHALLNDAQRQPLDDSRLADARLADQHRIVLFAAAQNLDHPLDLGLAADHRIELALGGAARQIDSELVEHAILGLVAGRSADTHHAGEEPLGMLALVVAQQRQKAHILVIVLVGRQVLQERSRRLAGHVVQSQYPRADRAAVVENRPQQMSRIEHVFHDAALARIGNDLAQHRFAVDSDRLSESLRPAVLRDDRAHFAFETRFDLIDLPVFEQFPQHMGGMTFLLLKYREKEVIRRHFRTAAATRLIASSQKDRLQFLRLLNLHGVFLI